MNDVTKLQQELDQSKSTIKGLMAQFDAAKQMFNETSATCLQLRTHLTLLNSNYQDLVNKNSELQAELAKVKSEYEALKAPATQEQAA
jgi:chromosome segregation ATPase